MRQIGPIAALQRPTGGPAIDSVGRRVTPDYVFLRRGKISWLFVATLPNSGSTALAQLLASAPSASMLRYNGEGQWLTTELSGPWRWIADHPVNLQKVRRIWLKHARGPADRLIVEKSPPNLCRMEKIERLFSDMPQNTISFSRDPYAICASWAKRYTPLTVTRDWAVKIRDNEPWMETLGRVCGERFAMLADVRERADAHVTYEALTEQMDVVVDQLSSAVPLLAGIDPDTEVKVKDYGAQKMRNMNAEQIARLSNQDLADITRGMAPFEESITSFGYRLR